MCTQELWVRHKACCTQVGPAQAAGHWDDMNRWQHSSHLFFTCTIGSLHRAVVRRDNLESSDFNTGTVSRSTKTNGINRLPCSYLYCSRHWIGKSMSCLCLAIEKVDCPWSDGSYVQLSSWVGLNECMAQYAHNKSRKWLMAPRTKNLNCTCTCKQNLLI